MKRVEGAPLLAAVGDTVAFVLADGQVRPAIVTRAWKSATEREFQGAPIVHILTAGSPKADPGRRVNLRVFWDTDDDVAKIVGAKPNDTRVENARYEGPQLGRALTPGTWHWLDESPLAAEAPVAS